VVLLDSGSNAIAVVREIRAATGVGIKEAKAMVEVLPHPVAEACLENEARQLSAQIEAAGGRAEVRPTLGTTNQSPQKPDNKPPRKRRGVRHRR
jgi:hypothetical protein